jgi:hypothetical protein
MSKSKLFTESIYGRFANFFVGPFIELSIERFYKDWFIDAYCDLNEPLFYVIFNKDVPDTVYRTKTYHNDFDLGDNKVLIIYKTNLVEDYEHFIIGAYSKMSEKLMQNLEVYRNDLKRNSTVIVNGQIQTTYSIIFSVIEKHPHYISIMESELGCKIPSKCELAQSPGIDNFKTFEEVYLEYAVLEDEREDN